MTPTPKTVIVYRLQNKEDKTGPFRSEFTSETLKDELIAALGGSSMTSDSHPTPNNDGIDVYHIRVNWVCGCQSLESLKDWFGPALHDLLKQGFEIIKAEVPANRVWVGKHQLIYCPDSAKQLSIVKLNSKTEVNGI